MVWSNLGALSFLEIPSAFILSGMIITCQMMANEAKEIFF